VRHKTNIPDHLSLQFVCTYITSSHKLHKLRSCINSLHCSIWLHRSEPWIRAQIRVWLSPVSQMVAHAVALIPGMLHPRMPLHAHFKSRIRRKCSNPETRLLLLVSLITSFQSYFPATMHSREFEIIHKQMYNIVNIRRINENSLNDFKYSLNLRYGKISLRKKEVNIFSSFLNTFLRNFHSNFPLIRKTRN
jgi:hypothetical protein